LQVSFNEHKNNSGLEILVLRVILAAFNDYTAVVNANLNAGLTPDCHSKWEWMQQYLTYAKPKAVSTLKRREGIVTAPDVSKARGSPYNIRVTLRR